MKNITEKKCTKCDVVKPLSEYRKYSGRCVGGVRPICKVCQRSYEKEWRSKSKDYRKEQRKKHREKDKLYRAEYNMRNKARYLTSSIKTRCKNKGLPFDLDKYENEINERIEKGICEVSGFPLRLEHGKRDFNSPSIDRVVPELGYVYSNIRIVAFSVNAALGDWGEDKFLQVLKHWKNNLI